MTRNSLVAWTVDNLASSHSPLAHNFFGCDTNNMHDHHFENVGTVQGGAHSPRRVHWNHSQHHKAPLHTFMNRCELKKCDEVQEPMFIGLSAPRVAPVSSKTSQNRHRKVGGSYFWEPFPNCFLLRKINDIDFGCPNSKSNVSGRAAQHPPRFIGPGQDNHHFPAKFLPMIFCSMVVFTP